MTLPFEQFREWWTAEEIAASGLPDMPSSKRGVNMLADRLGWRGHPEFVRRRSGRGGGLEYCWKLFPSRAQAMLLKRGAATPVAPERPDRGEAWAWFDGLPEKVKDQARARLSVLQRVEELAQVMTKFLAVGHIAQKDGISERTIWNWFGLIEGVDVGDRLAYLAPRHRAAPPNGHERILTRSSATG